MEQKQIRKMVLTAMFAALACVATLVIQVPSFGPSGYVNLGDCIVLLSAWVLGGGAGAVAAGLGSGLADVLSGYAFYAPGTFVIKFLMAFAAALIVKAMHGVSAEKKARGISLYAGYLVSAIAAEIIMILGYLFYEAVILGYGVAAAAAVVSNAIQGTMNIVIGMVMITALVNAKVLSKLGYR